MKTYLLVLLYLKNGEKTTFEIAIRAETKEEAEEKKQTALKHFQVLHPKAEIKVFQEIEKERVFVQPLGKKIGEKLEKLD